MNDHVASPGKSSAPPTSDGTVAINGTTTLVSGLVMDDETVSSYLSMFPPERRSEELARAISLGIHGLAATSMRATIETMTDEVRRILDTAAATAESHLEAALEAGQSELAAHLDPEIRSSLTARTVRELQELHAATLARLDPDRSDSHTAKLVASISDLLGPEGLLAQRLEDAFDSADADRGLGKVLDAFEKRFQEMRDLVVGGQQRESEAQRGTAKGLEFEDDVEAILRSEAKALSGCVVERTGQIGGTLGTHAKVGDFAVALPDGTRIAVEAKNSGRIGLTGSTGILAELDQAMDNRNASWAVCISKTDAYPGEVGSFGVYGNRLLIVESGDGTLTRVALRWVAAAARATAAGDDRLDTMAALERLARVRDLAQHFSRSKKVLSGAQAGLETVREELDSLRSQLLDLVDDIARALRPSSESERRVA